VSADERESFIATYGQRARLSYYNLGVLVTKRNIWGQDHFIHFIPTNCGGVMSLLIPLLHPQLGFNVVQAV